MIVTPKNMRLYSPSPFITFPREIPQRLLTRVKALVPIFITTLMGIGVLYPVCSAKVVDLDSGVRTAEKLSNAGVRLSGRSELHLTHPTEPLRSAGVDLTSEDAWLFLENIKPSVAVKRYLKSVRIRGKRARLNKNVRVVQYGQGCVIIPHERDFRPLTMFSEFHFSGKSEKLEKYKKYGDKPLGKIASSAHSFILKRGYMITLGQNKNGTGFSKTYIAQDCDLEVAFLPSALAGKIQFARVFPWRWVTKKGVAGAIGKPLHVQWWYNWNLNQISTLDAEYVAIRQNAHWPGLDQDWKKRGVTHLLGYNEPDKEDQANMSVSQAIAGWPSLLKTGLRVGAPAITDSGKKWLFEFMARAESANLRVDYVPVHYYRSYWNARDPEGAAKQFYSFLKEIHDRVKKPIWITEWNNGANWTENKHDPSKRQQKKAIEAMIGMLDRTPWVERYAIYNWVEDKRRVVEDNGSLTQAGIIYRDKKSPLAYRQEFPANNKTLTAHYLFAGNYRDSSGNAHNPFVYGAPKIAQTKIGSTLQLDGLHSYLRLPARLTGGENFTFMTLIRNDGKDPGKVLFSIGKDTQHHFSISPVSKDGSIELLYANGGKKKTLTGGRLLPEKWNHLALTISGDEVALYLNGKKEISEKVDHLDFKGFTQLYLGKGQDKESFFKGSLGNVRILNKALSEQGVTNYFTSKSLRFNKAELSIKLRTGKTLNASIAQQVEGANGELSFSKVSGPAWLTLSKEGVVSGTPTDSDEGTNNFLLAVEDQAGRRNIVILNIEVN